MGTTKVRITTNLEKRHSCAAAVPTTYEERGGKEIEVYLPPVSEAPPEITPCQSKWYWQVVTDEPGRWWVCEHTVDVD